MTLRFSASSATCVSVGWERARRNGWIAALALLALGLAGRESPAEETLYVDVWKGADGNQGAKDSPLKTLGEAARRINTGVGTGAVTIFVAEGVYPLQETVLIKPTRRFSTTGRLTIRAEGLPDDPDWTPSRMPVLLPVMPLSKSWMGRPDPFGGVAYGIQVETSHVTIQGFKVLGMPQYEFPASGQIHRVYPIAREGNALEDLEVKQCLFAGDPVALPLHCGVLARGHKVVIDHCVFHRCKIPVVPDPIAVESDPTHRRFLHLVDSAIGHELGAGLFTTARVKPSRESEKEDEAVPNAKQQVKELLESIESGDPKPAGVINSNKYMQHNPQIGDGQLGQSERLVRSRDSNQPRSLDGVRKVHGNTSEGIWTGLRNFLRIFRGVHKKYLQQYVAVFTWAYNEKVASVRLLRVLLGVQACAPT